MGDEVQQEHFEKADFKRFQKRLDAEMDYVRGLFHQNKFDKKTRKLGYELEVCLLNKSGQPSPVNSEVLAACNNSLFTSELAQFNLEINGNPFNLQSDVFHQIEADLTHWLSQASVNASDFGSQLGLFGILPSITEAHLDADIYMSKLHRYKLLSEILMQMHGGPINIELEGKEKLNIRKNDIMLEALGTSFQVHLQMPFDEAADSYNAALWASMVVLASSANSPMLLGKQCWQESRIGLFEQSVDTRSEQEIKDHIVPRVHFAKGFIKSMLELFEDMTYYDPILPEVVDTPIEKLHHFKMHNGTIWRWVRPILDKNSDGQYHLRLELRVLPSGPTVIDTIANMAFFIGLIEGLRLKAGELTKANFSQLESDFYQSAKAGLDSKVHWIDNQQYDMKVLILDQAIPLALSGLKQLGISKPSFWLDIIRGRVSNEQTGARWIELQWQRCHKADELVNRYLQLARENQPVHLWPKDDGKSNTADLSVLNSLPEGFFNIDYRRIRQKFPTPTLVHLVGRKPDAIFVSILLHGNEYSGLKVMQKLLKKYQQAKLPRSIYLFIGNVAAAEADARLLPEQVDFNRSWPGTDMAENDITRLMQQVFEIVTSDDLFVAIDIHNNTGSNPHYACITEVTQSNLHLAAMFNHIGLHFTSPRGVSTMAFNGICPASTLECAKPGDQFGIDHACEMLDGLLHMDHFPDRELPAHDLQLSVSFATIKIAEGLSFTFNDSLEADIRFESDFEKLNFTELNTGDIFAWSRMDNALIAKDRFENDITHQVFEHSECKIRLKRTFMPVMITTDMQVIRQDCLCYLLVDYEQ